MDYETIFRQAVLLQLRTSCWSGSKTLQQGVLENVGNSQWLKGKKMLINPELLGSIKTTIHKARQVIQRNALPFPLTGLSLVPKDAIEDVDAELDYFRDEFWVKVDVFMDHYEGARDEARMALGDLFNETDYPMDIRNKFRFDWRFLLLDVPDKASILSPEIYAREKQKFADLMEETRQMSVMALREEFGSIVTHLVDKLNPSEDGKPKTFRSDMTRKLNDFLLSFGDKNIFNDDRLAELVNEAQNVLNGMDTPYALSYNEVLRQRVAQDMGRLKQEIDVAIQDLPKRKIQVDVETHCFDEEKVAA